MRRGSETTSRPHGKRIVQPPEPVPAGVPLCAGRCEVPNVQLEIVPNASLVLRRGCGRRRRRMLRLCLF